MRVSSPFLTAAAVALLMVGCAGPQQKMGRGITNALEFTRLGELSRNIEHTGMFDNPNAAYTTGFIRGFDASMRRTALGLYEIITFPFPNGRYHDYGPVLKPEYPVFPDSYEPAIFSDSIFSTDSSIGFGRGDIAPMLPGSRFRIFEN